MSARKCRCGGAIILHENGDLRCTNGHSQPQAAGDLVKAMVGLVERVMVPLRDRIEDHESRIEVMEPRVEHIDDHANVPASGNLELVSGPVGLEEAARIAGVSKDTLYRNAERYGGWKVDPSKPKSHWRFDPEQVRRAGANSGPGKAPPVRRAPQRRSAPLLPVKDRAA